LKRLAADRRARFAEVKREVHALAAYHHRCIGQTVRRQRERQFDYPNLF
jgi:hypothetical protein